MSGATEIGKVAVRVMPDTSGFKKKAEGELKKIAEGLKIEVEVLPDFTQFRQQLKEELAKDTNKVIDVTADLGKHTAEEIQSELDRASFEIKTKAELKKDAEEHLKHEIERIDAELSVGISEVSRRRIQAVLKFMARLRRVEFKPVLDKAAAAKVALALKAITGGRLLGKIAGDFREWASNLDKAVPKLMAVTGLVSNLGSYLLTATSNAFTFGSSLASIGGAGLALPGIIGGLAIGVTAFAVAMKDFNKHVPAFAISGSKATTAGEAWKHLQDTMSSNFWKTAEAPIQRLVKTLFPQFAAGMNSISTDLGGFTAKLSTSLTGAFNGELKSMFDDLGESIRVMSKYTDNLAGIFAKLGAVGAGNLPKLAGWFGEITRDFDKWLARKGKNGLQDFVDVGIDALKDLGSVIASTSRTLAGIARAAEAAGGSTLAMMADTMRGVADAVNGAHFQEKLTNVFEAAHEAMSKVANKSGPAFSSFMDRLSDTLSKVLPKAGSALGNALDAIFSALDQPSVQHAAVSFFASINKTVKALAPAMPGLADSLASAVSLLGDMGENVAKFITPAFQALNDVLGPLLKLLDSLPDPVKGFIFQLGLGVTAMAYLGKASDVLKVKLQAVAAQFATVGAKGKAAGILGGGILLAGGLAAISSEAGKTSKAVGTIGSALSWGATGAMIGSTFGPLGTAIGGVGGAALGASSHLMSMKNASNQAKEAAANARPTIGDYAASLDQVTGAATRATRAVALKAAQDAGVLDLAGQLDISTQDLISSTLGQEGATKRVTKALRKNGFELNQMDYSKFNSWLGDNTRALDQAGEAIRNNVADTSTWKQKLKSMPKAVKIAVKQSGASLSIKELNQILAKNKELTKKQTKVLVSLVGDGVVVKKINGVRKALVKASDAKPNMEPWIVGMNSAVTRGKNKAVKGVQETNVAMLMSSRKARPDIGPFQKALNAAIDATKTLASSGMHGVGTNMKAGVLSGFAGTQLALVGQAVAAVTAAISAAKHAGDIHSPSRKMRAVGQWLGKGLVVGLQKTTASSAKAAKVNVEKIISSTLAVGQKVLNKFDGKTLKSLSAKYKAAYNELKQSVAKLRQLKSEASSYQQQIVQQIQATADPSRDGAASFQAVLMNMKIARDEAVKFAEVIKSLAKKGLDKNIIAQLVAAGPEAALAAAQSIDTAGADGVKALNGIQKDINAAAQDLGKTAMSVQFGDQIAKQIQQIKKAADKLRPVQSKLSKAIRAMLAHLAQVAKKGVAGINAELGNIGKRVTVRADKPKAARAGVGSTGSASSTNVTNILNYFAAPGEGISSEEKLFAAAKRGRMAFG